MKNHYTILSTIAVLSLLVVPALTSAQPTDRGFKNDLDALRTSRQELKETKVQEAQERAAELSETVEARKAAALQRREDAQERMEAKRKEVLLKLIAIQIKHLERTQERVNRMPNISDELKAELALEIDGDITTLNGFVSQGEAVEGRDEIKELAGEVRTFFKSYRERVTSIVETIHASRLTDAVLKAETRLAAVKEKVAALKAQGKNTTSLEADIEDAGEGIDDAQEEIGRQAFREANEDLKGAYQTFREIAQKAQGL